MEQALPKLNSKIKEIIATVDNGNVTRFAKRLKNVSQQRLNRIFNTDTRTGKYPSVPDDVLVAIAKSMPDVNLDWLLADKGDMLKKQINQNNVHGDNIAGDTVTVNKTDFDKFMDLLTAKDEQIKTLLELLKSK
jgi:hypothetical protein